MADGHDTEEPTVLYKYLSAPHALHALPQSGNGSLRATQPAAMNDPLECTISCHTDYSSIATEAEEIADVLNSIAPGYPISGHDVQPMLKQHGTNAWSKLFVKQLSKRFGIVSFSKTPFDLRMWAHYANSSFGYVIGYQVSYLKEIAARCGQLGSVCYGQNPPAAISYNVFKSVTNLYEALMTKGSNWASEQEWRLILELKHTIGTGKLIDEEHPFHLCPIPNEAVVEVYYTEQTKQHRIPIIEGRLKNSCNRYGTSTLKKLVQVAGKYELENLN